MAALAIFAVFVSVPRRKQHFYVQYYLYMIVTNRYSSFVKIRVISDLQWKRHFFWYKSQIVVNSLTFI